LADGRARQGVAGVGQGRSAGIRKSRV